MSNAREAREVAFVLFQDLDGFSLDDYKPFSDVTTGMDQLIHFLSAAVADRQSASSRWTTQPTTSRPTTETNSARFTSKRELLRVLTISNC